MYQANRRTALKLLGGIAVTAGAVPLAALPGAAQEGDIYVPKKYQNFKRGTINSMHPEARSFTIVWEDVGRVKLKASDLVTNFNQLKPGQVCDVQWYDYVDFLVAPKSAAAMAKASAMVAKGARIEGIGGVQPLIKLWEMDGMITKIDPANSQIYLIYKSGGEPEHPVAHAGEVIQMPSFVSDAGKSALASFKPGDDAVCVYSQQTAVTVKIIR